MTTSEEFPGIVRFRLNGIADPGARSIVAGFFHLLAGHTGRAARAFQHAKQNAVSLPAKLIADRLAKHAGLEGMRQLLEYSNDIT